MPLNIGDPAPNFTLKDVVTGQTHTLANYAGFNVFLIFSGPSWCPPCQFEAPVLQELWQVFGNAVPKTQFLMVSVNETEQPYRTAVQNFGLTFPCLYDPTDSVWGQYLVTGVPTTYVVNKQQQVCNFHVGIITPADALYSELYSMLISCGSSDQAPSASRDITRWRSAVTILFGVTNDAGGVVLTPGGRPVPVDPWGPLTRMSPEKKNILISLAAAELTKSIRDPGAAGEMEIVALRSAEASMKKLLVQASRKPLEPSISYSPVKKK